MKRRRSKIALTLAPWTIEALAAIAAKTGRSRSSLVDEAVENLAKKLGAYGARTVSAQSDPDDPFA